MYEGSMYSKPLSSDSYCSIYHPLRTAIEGKEENKAYAKFKEIIDKGCTVPNDDAIKLVSLLAERKMKTEAGQVLFKIKNIESTVFNDLIDQIFGKCQPPFDANLAIKLDKMPITNPSNFVGTTVPNDNYCELRASLLRTLEKAKLLAEAKNAYNIFQKIINNGWTLDLGDIKKLLNLLIDKNLKLEAAKVFIHIKDDIEEEIYVPIPADTQDIKLLSMENATNDKLVRTPTSVIYKPEGIPEINDRLLDLFCNEIGSSEIREITKISICDLTSNHELKHFPMEIELNYLLLQENTWAKFPKENVHLFLAYNLNKEIVGFLVGEILKKTHEQVFHDHEPQEDEFYQHVDEPHFYLHSLFVQKDYRNENGKQPPKIRIGTQLMLEAFKKTKDLGLKKLALSYEDEMDQEKQVNRRKKFYNQLEQFGGATIEEKPYQHCKDFEEYDYIKMSSVVFNLSQFNYSKGIEKLKQKLVSEIL